MVETPNGAAAEQIVVSWDDVLKQTGATARKVGLAAFNGLTPTLTRFADEQKGKKNVRWELTADATVNGESPRRVVVPQHYADRIREKIEQLGERAVNLAVTVRIEVSESGTIMIRPLTAPAPPEPAPEGETPRRRGRPRRETPIETPHAPEGASTPESGN